MKEILQTKYFKHVSISACVVCVCWSARASFHVDTTAQVRQLTEDKEPEVVYQEQEPGPEPYEVADQEPECTNSENQQGKHRCILTQCRTSVESLII